MALSAKQRAFIDHYLQCWNAAEAARLAGYSEKSARNIGHENLTKPDISAEVRRRINERTMSADEVLVRLAAQARADMGEWTDDSGNLDLAAMRAAGATHLLKKVKRTVRRGTSKDGGEWEHEQVEVEVYDAQAALVHIGKQHKLFTDRIEHDVHGHVEITGDELAAAQAKAAAFEAALLDEDGDA